MPRFVGGIEGASVPKREFSGSENGLFLRLSGQNVGVSVRARVENGRDILEIWQDWGWAGKKPAEMLGVVTGGQFIPVKHKIVSGYDDQTTARS